MRITKAEWGDSFTYSALGAVVVVVIWPDKTYRLSCFPPSPSSSPSSSSNKTDKKNFLFLSLSLELLLSFLSRLSCVYLLYRFFKNPFIRPKAPCLSSHKTTLKLIIWRVFLSLDWASDRVEKWTKSSTPKTRLRGRKTSWKSPKKKQKPKALILRIVLTNQKKNLFYPKRKSKFSLKINFSVFSFFVYFHIFVEKSKKNLKKSSRSKKNKQKT